MIEGIFTALTVGIIFGLWQVFLAYGRWREHGSTREITFAEANEMQSWGKGKILLEFAKDFWHGSIK